MVKWLCCKLRLRESAIENIQGNIRFRDDVKKKEKLFREHYQWNVVIIMGLG